MLPNRRVKFYQRAALALCPMGTIVGRCFGKNGRHENAVLRRRIETTPRTGGRPPARDSRTSSRPAAHHVGTEAGTVGITETGTPTRKFPEARPHRHRQDRINDGLHSPAFFRRGAHPARHVRVSNAGEPGRAHRFAARRVRLSGNGAPASSGRHAAAR